ncbi:MAG: DUF885 domain-containing protein, partial [Clostridiales Family XIII bacterium]|nr:DUF885 domain-containing protein [Clostridiales Family XIII bacterium]
MFGKSRVFALILAAVIFASAFTGCGVSEKPVPSEGPSFDAFADELFRHYASADSISLNYILAHPENYGIEKPAPTFGGYSTEAFEAEAGYCEGRLKELKAFDYDRLSYEQQLTYDVVHELLAEGSAEKDFLYYGDALSPTSGIQAQLPTLLSEYHIYEKEDFGYYIELLAELPGYFEDIAAFEREKKGQGTFMAKVSAENVIKQIEAFIENPEANLLLKVFDEKVDAFEGLADEERADLKARNKTAVLGSVVPAYRSLADSLAELNADNPRTGGLSSIRGGKEYYEYLTKASSGSQRGMDELENMVDGAIVQSMATIATVYQSDPPLLAAAENPSYPASEPNEILDYLKNAIPGDFPAATGDGYELKYVDESLEGFVSPAFYLIPPIDDTAHNVIYLNNSYLQDTNRMMFPTLAHEGYPGHLYQTVYFRRLGRAPIRSLLSTDGYVEGWAIYVEQMSYRLAGLDDNLAALLAANMAGSLCISAKIDIAVNARGWGREDVREYFSQLGVGGEESANEIYDAVVAEPLCYAKYVIGYLEILELKKNAR